MATQLKTKLIVTLGVLGMSFSAILVRYSAAPSMVLVFYRLFFAALIMTVPGIRGLVREWPDITAKDLFCCLVSGFFLALHFNAYFTAVKLTSIAAAVVLVDAEVFFVSFAMLFFFREKLKKQALFGILITFAGSVIIALGDAGGGGGSLAGDLWALSGALFMGIYTVMGKICRRHMSTGSYTMLVYWVTTLTALAFLRGQGLPVIGYSLTDIGCAFGMTILCTLLGHSVFSWGLKYISPAFISTVKLLEPVFASLLAILLFTEIPAATAVIGGMVVIGGIWLTGRAV